MEGTTLSLVNADKVLLRLGCNIQNREVVIPILTYCRWVVNPYLDTNMYCYQPQYIQSLPSGKVALICPRPALVGAHLVQGKLSSVKTTDKSYYSETGFKYWSTLNGIQKTDAARLTHDVLLYKLGDGTLLLAPPDSICGELEHRAGQNRLCFTHRVDKLAVVSIENL
jgi:hypothetical protein